MASPLSGDLFSSATTVILHRFKLTGEFAKDPAAVIRTLHDKALTDKRRDILFALAELSYFEGEHLHNSTKSAKRRKAPDFFLLSAVYAYYQTGHSCQDKPETIEEVRRILLQHLEESPDLD